jgi:hypothetical protein
MTGQSILRLLPIAAFLLGGCASDSHPMDNVVGSVPGYADTRPCSEVIGLVAGYKQQVKQLTELVVKAQSDAGGTFVSAIAYNTDLAKAQARLRDAEEASRNKHCDPNEKATAPPPETIHPLQPGLRPAH